MSEQKTPLLELQPDWPPMMLIGLCHSSLSLRKGSNLIPLSGSAVCFENIWDEVVDVTKVTIGVCLTGAAYPVSFQFASKRDQQQFNDFLCAHVDVDQPLTRFPSYDIAQAAAAQLAEQNSPLHIGSRDAQEDMLYALTMCSNVRLAQAASEQLSVKAQILRSPDGKTLVMVILLKESEGEAVIVSLTAEPRHIDDEVLAHHFGEEFAPA